MAEFNLEGLLGNVFGGGGGNFLDEYLTPEQKAAMQRKAMLAASAALGVRQGFPSCSQNMTLEDGWI